MVFAYPWTNYSDLTATSLEWWLIRWMIPKYTQIISNHIISDQWIILYNFIFAHQIPSYSMHFLARRTSRCRSPLSSSGGSDLPWQHSPVPMNLQHYFWEKNMQGSSNWYPFLQAFNWRFQTIRHISHFFLIQGIPLHRPYISLIYGRYLQFRFLKWPST